MDKKMMDRYTALLRQELQTALGCTEPIAIAYCAACARNVLGAMPERMRVSCSGNMIKNTAAVTVPMTGGLHGVAAAALAGAVSGRADLELEVLSTLTDADREEIRRKCEEDTVEVSLLKSEHPLHIVVEAEAGGDTASVEVVGVHTGIGRVMKNGRELHRAGEEVEAAAPLESSMLRLEGILEYAGTVPLSDVQEILDRQVECNMAIAREGLKNDWGAAVGKTLLEGDKALYTRMRAAAAAGSDARMNGCPLPVVINCGSGNQGITASVPLAVYAAEKGLAREKLLRALCVSNLVALEQKAKIGRLSAFCGAVCAAVGAACGVAWLDGASYEVICQCAVNALACVGGIFCDGAKSSCAGKIAAALDCALVGYEMARRGRGYRCGEGIVRSSADETIDAVGEIAANGMRATDQEILRVMIKGR